MNRLFNYPLLSSAHGDEIDRLMIAMHGFIGLFFLGWFLFFGYCLIRFRAGHRQRGRYQGLKGRWVYYLAGAVLVLELFFDLGLSRPYGDTTQYRDDTVNAQATAPLEVRVVAQQFAWNVHYPGPDGVFGATRPELVREESNPMGLDAGDLSAQDDLTTLNHLVLPVDRPVRIYLSSKDVVHSFSLPEFRVKQDIIPGIETELLFTPTMTTATFQERMGDPTRRFEIVCAQLCGLGHYRMRGFVTVLEAEAFADWLEAQTPHFSEEYDPFWD